MMLGHIAIRARDIEATAAFYRDVLGMPEAFRMQDPSGSKLGSVHIYIAPSQFIEIFPNGAEEPGDLKTTIGLVHFCIEVDNAAKTLEAIRSRGAPIDVELKTGYSRCIQFWTHDPDGNAVEFMELPPESLQQQALGKPSDS
ncbi:MAG: VOC family protein [Treponema sp.]|jgi:lactoylglutathione lyase|nr:VOC family protein [Treponema sp.]